MWALVFACEALCHESSTLLFNSGIQDYKVLRGRAAAQISWAVGRFNYINNRNGIRQSAVFADHFRERWAAVMDPTGDVDAPFSPAQSSSYVFDIDPATSRFSTEGSCFETVVDESEDPVKHVNDMCSPCH